VPPTTAQTANLNWLLDDLVARIPAIRQSVVLSADGLMMGGSATLAREDAEHLCAMASGFQSLARGASRHFRAGPPRQTVVEMEDAYLVVTAAGRGACLAVLAGSEADLGLVAYEMAMLVVRVGQTMDAPARPGIGHPEAN
jgi:predicted regulator of Ras-like GTPase activity (Roadblock/LC7/MglB family)